jgi:hypothetical protein
MDHRRIEEMNIPELYATGRLSSEDEEDFETHLLECRECREQVAWADDFGTSVRTVAVAAVEEVARVATRAGFLVWLARRGAAVRMGLTAALLVLAALPAWLLVERSSLQAELAKARSISEPAQRAERAERPAPQAAASLPTPPAAPTATATSAPTAQNPDTATQAELDRLAQELSRERQAREALAGRMAALTQPQINTPVVSLGVVRGMSNAGEVELGPDPEWIVLSLELPAADHDTYRATLFDAAGRRVWQRDGNLPTASDTLIVLVYSDLLKPGEYRMSLEGVDGGRAVPAGEIPFRVRRQG